MGAAATLNQFREQRMGDAMVQFVQIVKEFFGARFGRLALGRDTVRARLEATVHAVNVWLQLAFLLCVCVCVGGKAFFQ